MRGIALALTLSLALGAPALAAPVDEPEWVLWSDDGQDYPAPLAADVKAIRAGPTATQLHIEFTTQGTLPPMLVASELQFVADQAGQVSLRFVWEEAPRLWIGEEELADGWKVADGSGPTGWHLLVDWDLLGVNVAAPFALRDLDATTRGPAVQSLCTPCDPATGPDLEFIPDAAGQFTVSVATLEPGVTVEGPDYAGGASVTVDERGEPIIAYYIYDGERGPAQGIYLARISEPVAAGVADATGPAFAPERIGDTKVSRDGGRDDQMRTQVAHDGKQTFVLFTDDPAVDNDEDGPGHLGTPDSVHVLAAVDGTWRREDPTPNGKSDVGPEDVSDLVARAGRVVAAVPVANDVWIVERVGPSAWREVARLSGANNAKLALDSQGVVHAAYVVYETDDGSWRDGKLYYASSKDAFKATHIGDNIDSGWETPETDGSFAIAAGPRDEVALLWNDGRADREKEQKVAILSAGAWTPDFAPLVPSHGNPQYTMRLGYTAKGHLVAASGYGGTDTLAVRGPNGGWVIEDLDRYDVWDMTVAPSGTIYFAYTQPHGGTTVALTAFGVSPLLSGDATAGVAAEPAAAQANGEAGANLAQPVRADASPRLAPGAAFAAVLVVLGLAVLGRRRLH